MYKMKYLSETKIYMTHLCCFIDYYVMKKTLCKPPPWTLRKCIISYVEYLDITTVLSNEGTAYERARAYSGQINTETVINIIKKAKSFHVICLLPVIA